MKYYSSFGHGGIGDATAPTLTSILADEKAYPNSTVDAKRIIGTIRSLANSDSSGTLLDVGCGYGFFSKEALCAGFQVKSLELAANERGISFEMTGTNPTACSFEEFDCAPGSLSAVLMSQILEHALDVNMWIDKARDLLGKDGVLAIALPNYGSVFRMILQEKEPYICPPAHLNYFSKRSLSRLLEKHGFRVEKTQWTSRVSRRSIAKRLPRIGRPFLPMLNVAASVTMGAIDAIQLGMMVTVYGRKLNAK